MIRGNRSAKPIFMAARPGFCIAASTREVEGDGRDGEGPEPGVELDGVEVAARRGPVLRRQLKMALVGPVRPQHDLVEVLLGVDAVQAARGDEAEDSGGDQRQLLLQSDDN